MSARKLSMWFTDGVIAGATAAMLSGIPSTLHALLSGGDVCAALLAAGSIAAGHDASPHVLVLWGITTHAAVSLFWALVLRATLPESRTIVWGGAAGGMIAVLDLRLIGPAFEGIRTLPFALQLFDHVLFGLVVGTVLVILRKRRGKA